MKNTCKSRGCRDSHGACTYTVFFKLLAGECQVQSTHVCMCDRHMRRQALTAQQNQSAIGTRTCTMDPEVSKTLLSLVSSLPDGRSLMEEFPLVFQGQTTTTTVNNSRGSGPTLVNSVTGPQLFNVSQANEASASSVGSPVPGNEKCTLQQASIPIKVVNPLRKRDGKSYMLYLDIEKVTSLKSLQEEILEQLGKAVVSFDLKFDLGYFSGSQRICFSASDNLSSELQRLSKNGKSLWCEGLPKRNDSEGCICLDSDSDNEEVIKPKKRKVKPESNAYVDKVKRVDALANELKKLHGEKYNKIQLKL